VEEEGDVVGGEPALVVEVVVVTVVGDTARTIKNVAPTNRTTIMSTMLNDG
jgi:hypothetical protein